MGAISYWEVDGVGWTMSSSLSVAERSGDKVKLRINVTIATYYPGNSDWGTFQISGTHLATQTVASSATYSGGSYTYTTDWITVGYGAGSLYENVYYTKAGYATSPSFGGSVSYTDTYTAPTAPSSVTNTRNSDSQNTVAWTNNASSQAPWDSVEIQRSVDGGSYSTIATGISGSATSWSDTSTSSDHSYAYKVVAVNTKGSAASSATSTTYNTPKAPTSISLARLSGGINVGITIGNTANTATGLDIERSSDRSTWTALTSLSGLITYTTDSPGGGTFYYRVRNTRGALASDWIVSDAVVTVIAPNPPTLVSPAAGSIVNKSAASITFSWTHNPIDGSAQTAAVLSYSTNNGSSWTNVTISGAANTYTLANNFATNDVVLWKVKTKGAATTGGSGSGYSEYSSARSFTVYQVPTVNITSPSQGASITATPITVAFSYSDTSGTQADVAIVVTDSNGAVAFSRSIGSATSYSITVGEWAPTNTETYTITVNASSTSSLQASASVSVTIAFVPPAAGIINVQNDDIKHFVAVYMDAETPGSGEVAAESLTLVRIANGEEVTLTTGAAPGSSYVDQYAPLNTQYTYKLVSVANSGAIATVSSTNTVESFDGLIQYGIEQQIAGKYDPSMSAGYERPDRELVYYWGRTDPVSYDSMAVEESHEFSFVSLASGKQIADLMRNYAGIGVYRSLTGEVMHVCVTADGDSVLSSDARTEVKLKMQRIDGDVL